MTRILDVTDAICWLKAHGQAVGDLVKTDGGARAVAEAYTRVYRASGDKVAHVLLVERLNAFIATHPDVEKEYP